MTHTSTRAGRGRQAEAARNDTAVLDAARVIIAVHGPEAPVALIAQTAQVGVASLYRRFPSKEHLLEHLCRLSLDEQIHEARRAGTVTDPWQGLEEFIMRCVERRVGAFSALAGRFTPGPAMIAAAREAHAALEQLVTRAQAAEVLRPDVTAVDIHNLVGLFSHRPAEQEQVHSRLLSVALAGLRTTEGKLAQPPILWDAYEKRWRA